MTFVFCTLTLKFLEAESDERYVLPLPRPTPSCPSVKCCVCGTCSSQETWPDPSWHPHVPRACTCPLGLFSLKSSPVGSTEANAQGPSHRSHNPLADCSLSGTSLLSGRPSTVQGREGMRTILPLRLGVLVNGWRCFPGGPGQSGLHTAHLHQIRLHRTVVDRRLAAQMRGLANMVGEGGEVWEQVCNEGYSALVWLP